MIAAILFTLLVSAQAQENPSAYEIYSRLLEEGVDARVKYSKEMPINWILVRTGRSHVLLNLISPSGDTLDELIQSLTSENQQLFLEEFFAKKDGGGTPGDFQEAWRKFLAEENKKGDVPLASLTEEMAQNIFYGNFPGLERIGLSSTYGKQWRFAPGVNFKAEQFGLGFSSTNFAFNLGVHGDESEWTLIFPAQKSYGDFEEMLRWVRKVLGLPNSLAAERELHMMEFNSDFSSKQEKIRLHLLKVINSYGRMPFDDIVAMRLNDQATAARILSQDLSGIGRLSSWDWSGLASVPTPRELADRFGVSLETAKKALHNIAQARKLFEFWGANLLVPLNAWRQIPFLGESKARALESLGRTFIQESAKLEGDEESLASQMLRLQRIWAYASSSSEDIEFALTPRPRGPIGKALFYAPPSSGENAPHAVDVNKIALGIEYTGRFPIETYVYTGKAPENPDEKHYFLFPWDKEREEVIEGVARELSRQLRGTGEVHQKAGGHGHGLGYSYTFLDGQGRSWRVDWDGIRRTYDEAGNIVEGSVGGGHLEVSTAKFVPKVWEVEAVYSVFKKFNITPSQSEGGGGHINIDLAPFEGRPKAVARFLALFHQYQEIIHLMFGSPNNFFYIGEHFLNKLKNFSGTEEELKEMLYNERYFYSSPNAKTRYVSINIIPYFQEVIPKEFFAEDVDQANPTVLWKPRFRFVSSEEKRIELRFFAAPRDAFESALHIRFVRAMLHAALNEDFSLEGLPWPEFNSAAPHLYPQKAFRDFNSLCRTLQLECHLYRPLVAEGLSGVDLERQMSGQSLQELEKTAAKKMATLGQILENDHVWGRAVPCQKLAREIL